MPAKGVMLRRVARWALIVCGAVALWFMGYEGGRPAGVKRGRQEGIAAGKEQGLSETLELLDPWKRDRLMIGVVGIVFERLNSQRPANPGPPPGLGLPRGPAIPGGPVTWGQQAMYAEAQKLVDEICEEIAPGTWNLEEGGGNRIEATGLTLHMQGDPSVITEVGMYLKSKDDYLMWKHSGKPAP